ncbi:alpha/beta hydrolase family protein [Lentilactobacillus otakiensis]|uniref:alpha/beta hydrolase family protein n=1 Tax=Lentilactobacillus otakiensis TaxID=481720 RepID=UPI00293C5961|nr:alpha/beta fold hydrolase [Lentilactobacillus otakiensis]MDV3517198.1 alpha/beta fold hydrolase [Lentilactobacillus otakiensis]
MKLIFNDPTFSFETIRTLGYSAYGGSDLSEVVTTANKINDGDFESWYTNWNALAVHVNNRAKSFENSGELLSAGQNYLKASNYFRTAEFFLHGRPDDPRLISTWENSRETFRTGIQLSAQNVEFVEIPYENTTMPGYFYWLDDKPRPTLLVHGGYDSTGEELYFQIVIDALANGYNILTFEGPGQGEMVRKQKLAFRPDWENVVSPAIDFLETKPVVDNKRIALMGISFGGLLAPRAAAFDHRIAAVIADDGLFSFDFFDAFAARGHHTHDFGGIEKIIQKLMAESTQVRWVIENGMFTFGAKSVQELFQLTQKYTLKNVAEKIECPVLVCDAANDGFFKGQPELLYSHLKSSKTLMKFDQTDGAQEHCQIGAIKYYNQKVFQWLNKSLK